MNKAKDHAKEVEDKNKPKVSDNIMKRASVYAGIFANNNLKLDNVPKKNEVITELNDENLYEDVK